MNNDPSVIKATTVDTSEIITNSNNKFYVGLSKIKANIIFKESLKKETSNALTNKNKTFEIISDNFNDDSLTKFEAPTLVVPHTKSDFKFIKEKYKVDEIVLIKVNNYGLLLVYSGVLLATKKGQTLIDVQKMDLKNNSLLQQKRFETNTAIKSDWTSRGDYENLQTAIQTTIDKSILKIKEAL